MNNLKISDMYNHHLKEDGTPAYEERFDWVGDFFDSLTSVEKDEKY